MDTENKDNLTDVVETLAGVEIPESRLQNDSERTVLNSDGEAITLDQKESTSK